MAVLIQERRRVMKVYLGLLTLVSNSIIVSHHQKLETTLAKQATRNQQNLTRNGLKGQQRSRFLKMIEINSSLEMVLLKRSMINSV